jgi:hypothetical protein
MGSFPGDDLIKIEHRAGNRGERGEFGGVQLCVQARFTDREQLFRRPGILAEISVRPIISRSQQRKFRRQWLAREEQSETMDES